MSTEAVPIQDITLNDTILPAWMEILFRLYTTSPLYAIDWWVIEGLDRFLVTLSDISARLTALVMTRSNYVDNQA